MLADVRDHPADPRSTAGKAAGEAGDQVTAARGQVEDRDRLLIAGKQPLDSVAKGTIGERPGVQAGESVQGRIMIRRRERRIIHEFGLQ